MIDVAYAMAGSAQGGAEANPLLQLIPFIGIFVVFYFFLIRPQQKRAKERKLMLETLKKGDNVVTQGGLCGRIAAIEDSFLTLEVADKVKVRVLRAFIVGPVSSQLEPNQSNADTGVM
jgi:preprotein translocase subunit YajC